MSEKDGELLDQLPEIRKNLMAQLSRRIVGQHAVIDQMLTALFSKGHCLFIGVPGLAKTLLVTSVGQVLGLSSGRIQFTPDLMPADITGTEVIEEDRSTGRRELRFIPGPIFTHLLLADEINRTPPRTQAALLQAMQEGKVTSGGRTMPLEAPFLVFATQNPIEQEGTYPLPEAQLDRFMFAIDVGYPSEEEEVAVVESTMNPDPEPLHSVITRETLMDMQGLIRRIAAQSHHDVVRLAVRLARATRPGPDAPAVVRKYLQWGAGPRASQYLLLGAAARAALEGLECPNTEHVLEVAPFVLQHRLVLNFAAEAESRRAPDLIAELQSSLEKSGVISSDTMARLRARQKKRQ